MSEPGSESVSTSLASDLRLVVGRLARRTRQEVAGEITPSQRSVLAQLVRVGPLTMGELAHIERMTRANASGMISRLAASGLVEKRRNPEDGRSWIVQASEEGRQVLAEDRAKRVAFLADRLEALTESEIETISKATVLLQRLTD